MGNVIFISPNFPTNYWQFCRELRNDGMNVLGIGDCPYDQLQEELRESLCVYYKVERLEKYSCQKDGLLIRPARTQEELAEDGKALHHCVCGYIQRMAEGETAIFFIRKADAPDTPYFTLELQKKRVIQCRTARNASYTQCPEVLAFVQEWERTVAAKGGVRKKKEEPVA